MKLSQGHAKGFSLIEILVVLVLLGLMVCLGSYSLGYLHRNRVRQEIDLLAATCFYMRSLAIAHHREYELDFDELRQSYTYENQVYHLPHTVRFGLLPGMKGPPSAPATVVQHAITFPGKKIIFYPDGIISSGTVYLTDESRRYAYALSNGIAQFSFLRTYAYETSWQLR